MEQNRLHLSDKFGSFIGVFIAAFLLGGFAESKIFEWKIIPALQICVKSSDDKIQIGPNGEIVTTGLATSTTEKMTYPLFETKKVSGVVESIKDGTMVITVGYPPDVKIKTRKILITDKTVVTKLIQKDPAQMKKEMAAFSASANGKTDTELVSGPDLFTTTTAQISDIMKGISVSVVAEQDVRDVPVFTAVEVSVVPSFTNVQAK